MRLIQSGLLSAYRGVRRSGVLATAPGRAAFEGAYWIYKSLLEARELAALKPFATDSSTVVDVGANIGFHTVRFADWIGRSGRVVAIEPERANFASLRARVARRGLGDRVRLVNAAAVEAPGRAFLQLNLDNPADHRVAESGEAVEAVSIDSLLRDAAGPRVSLIKIDVQGGELRVLRGARATIEAMRPALFVEFQEDCLAMAGTSPEALLAELSSLKYLPRLQGPGRHWQPVASAELFGRMRERGYLDVLFLPEP